LHLFRSSSLLNLSYSGYLSLGFLCCYQSSAFSTRLELSEPFDAFQSPLLPGNYRKRRFSPTLVGLKRLYAVSGIFATRKSASKHHLADGQWFCDAVGSFIPTSYPYPPVKRL